MGKRSSGGRLMLEKIKDDAREIAGLKEQVTSLQSELRRIDNLRERYKKRMEHYQKQLGITDSEVE